jgi:hypothetical protein
VRYVAINSCLELYSTALIPLMENSPPAWASYLAENRLHLMLGTWCTSGIILLKEQWLCHQFLGFHGWSHQLYRLIGLWGVGCNLEILGDCKLRYTQLLQKKKSTNSTKKVQKNACNFDN